MSRRSPELTGRVFGRLTVTKRTDLRRGVAVLWECLCACGSSVHVPTTDLLNGRTTSCGCLKREMLIQRNVSKKGIRTGPKQHIPIGTRFHSLTVMKVSEPIGTTHKWVCKCDCGGTKLISGWELRSGRIKSCGCLSAKHRERFKSSKGLAHFNVTHGATAFGTKLELRLTHNSWRGISNRCDNPLDTSYKNYGAKGVTYDPRWVDFREFLKDMGVRPSKQHWLDRIDPFGNYTPQNCRWLEGREANATNRRSTRWVVFREERLSLAQFSRKIGLQASGVSHYLKLGLTPDEIASPDRSRVLAARQENEANAALAENMGAHEVATAIRARFSIKE